ncbi:MAG: 5-(carboxyamino)imidazole ribonucleotide mutase [Candidatus Omnitrophica bacterium CG_4_9_14_0_2_um_filter_42_8]|nr:MAG: 5-(carboxyamino)imidazole ribonucleotide mutase [Candidatus Omnitrophica bacterium CG22_combo_CG10-13_8_21_14_all_43_16]PJC48374.1 MAG: 5-(carboxyamino)imidazole ribonucleotide mutase [Candidatus Omnitrophica bacterium CG_4_9_14_0_2_um_filter_42_8]
MPGKKKVLIGILMGSASDTETMAETEKILKQNLIPYEINVLSAHRNPDGVSAYAKAAEKRGLKVIICGAGMSAALAGVVSAHTKLPVIGVPMESGSLKGMDALLSTVQMPGGVPVACMAIGKAGAKNAAIFAMRILKAFK